ncbi:MAG TPA: hypothetical protein VIM11_11395 [Tepidisphaeraceae bacterium]|jgi:hypothetical protein
MSRVVEADESGSIRLAGEWTGAKPHARYIIEFEGGHVVLRLVEAELGGSVWHVMTPEQRAEDFRQWIEQQRPAQAHLTNEQLRRENMYD